MCSRLKYSCVKRRMLVTGFSFQWSFVCRKRNNSISKICDSRSAATADKISFRGFHHNQVTFTISATVVLNYCTWRVCGHCSNGASPHCLHRAVPTADPVRHISPRTLALHSDQFANGTDVCVEMERTCNRARWCCSDIWSLWSNGTSVHTSTSGGVNDNLCGEARRQEFLFKFCSFLGNVGGKSFHAGCP